MRDFKKRKTTLILKIVNGRSNNSWKLEPYLNHPDQYASNYKLHIEGLILNILLVKIFVRNSLKSKINLTNSGLN